MADILDISKDANPGIAFKNIFTKIGEIIKRTNTNTSDITTVTSDLASLESSLGTIPKVYKALLTQSGTDAPVATVLVNTLGDTPVLSYLAVGQYLITITTSEFVVGKTCISFGALPNTGTGKNIIFEDDNSDVDNLVFHVENYSATNVDNSLTNTLILIEVYP